MIIPAGFLALPLPVVQLSLAAVLKCGQSFRWSIRTLSNGSSPPYDSEYRFCLRDRVVCLQQSPSHLFYRSIHANDTLSEEEKAQREAETLLWLKDYFQLDVDLVVLYDQWAAADPVFNSYRTRFSGIRMLRQDPWENLISFICSSNNNISRIQKMVQSLCSHYSPPLISLQESDETERSYHPFPAPSALAGNDVAKTLRTLGFGYRAEFIQRTAKMLYDAHSDTKKPASTADPSEAWLLKLRDVDTAIAREELLKFVGVGRKVADCVLLMSLDKREVIPVDTHVLQIATKHYGLKSSTKGKTTMTPKLYDDVSSKLSQIWGDYAGWAHTVLFTADLKSFLTYGLTLEPPTPSPSPVKRKQKQEDTEEHDVEDSDLQDTPLKRRKKAVLPVIST